MSVTDPIADMLTRIRNANTANIDLVVMPSSKLKGEIARVLLEEGYIVDFDVVTTEEKKPKLRLAMKYLGNRRKAITGIKRISKPGLRVYVGRHDLPRVLGGLGIAIVSTPKGIMTDRAARKSGVGGEVLAYVW